MRVRAKDYARTLLDLVEADHAARDYRAALDSTAVTIRELRAELQNKEQRAEVARRYARHDVDVRQRALQWIGTTCLIYHSDRCWDNGRAPNAELSEERWCVGCTAAWGLGVDNPPELITT